MGDFDARSYKEFLRQAVLSEENYWTYIEQIGQSLLVQKEKEKYQPTLEFVNEVLSNNKEKGSIKFLAIRLLGSCILPQQYGQDSLSVNKDYVSRMLKQKNLLQTLHDICQYRIEVPDENRGTTMFKDEAQLAKNAFYDSEVLLNIVQEREQIETFVQDSLEAREQPSEEMLQQLTSALDRITDYTPQEEQEALIRAFEFYRHLTVTIGQLRQKQFAQKTYAVFRKKLLAEAEKSFPGLWISPSTPQQLQQQQQQQQEALKASNNEWGGGFDSKFDFGGDSKPAAAADGGFDGGFGGFNFDEQQQNEEREERERMRLKQKEDERIAAELTKKQDTKKSKGFSTPNPDTFGDGFNNGFTAGFGENRDSIGGNSSAAPNFGTFQTKQEVISNKPKGNQVRFDEFGYDNRQQEEETLPKFSNSNGTKRNNPQQFVDSDVKHQYQQPPAEEQMIEKRDPANPRGNSHSYTYHMQDQFANSNAFKNSQIRDSFMEFSDLSKSDISARDFPLRNTVINSKEFRGRLHQFNKEHFQSLQDAGLTMQIARRYKIANLKGKCPLIESSDLQIGVISERIFDQNSSRYLIKCDIYFLNKSLYDLENFEIELEGDHTSHLYVKNDSFPAAIEAKRQFKLNGLLTYSRTPYSLINANISGRLNGRDPGNVMPYFRTKWRTKRDQIIKSDSFMLNKRVIRSPVYFKRYFPQFAENITLDEFITQNKANSAVCVNYKLRGTVQLDIPSIEYMVKLIVRPNFTALIQIIPFSGYVSTAETLIDHLVFIFGQQ